MKRRRFLKGNKCCVYLRRVFDMESTLRTISQRVAVDQGDEETTRRRRSSLGLQKANFANIFNYHCVSSLWTKMTSPFSGSSHQQEHRHRHCHHHHSRRRFYAPHVQGTDESSFTHSLSWWRRRIIPKGNRRWPSRKILWKWRGIQFVTASSAHLAEA